MTEKTRSKDNDEDKFKLNLYKLSTDRDQIELAYVNSLAAVRNAVFRVVAMGYMED